MCLLPHQVLTPLGVSSPRTRPCWTQPGAWISEAISPFGSFMNLVRRIEWLTCLLIGYSRPLGTSSRCAHLHLYQPRRTGDTRTPLQTHHTHTHTQLLTVTYFWQLRPFEWIFPEGNVPTSSKKFKSQIENDSLVKTRTFICPLPPCLRS